MNAGCIFTPIGVIRTPFKKLEGMPVQPSGARGTAGSVEVRPEYAAGLADLDGFSHIVLIYHLHRSDGFTLQVVPFLDTVPRGLFSTRAPRRPNPIGISVVRLEGVEENTLHVLDVDMLDGTPLLDIKPHVPSLDPREGVRTGWLEGKAATFERQRSDDRFSGADPRRPETN